MLVHSDPAMLATQSCPSLPGKGHAKFLASGDNHLLRMSCHCIAPKPCLDIFACLTCAAWTEEQWIHFSKCHTHHKNLSVSFPTPEPDDLIVVDSTEPIVSPHVGPVLPLNQWLPPRLCWCLIISAWTLRWWALLCSLLPSLLHFRERMWV